MGTPRTVNRAERRDQNDSAVVGGYMMHSAQARLAMVKLAFGQQLFTILIVVLLAAHTGHFTAVTALVIAVCTVLLPVLHFVPWQSLPPLSFIPYLWFSVGIYVVMAFDFNDPDVLLGAFTVATLFASAFWYKRWLMILHLAALLAVFAATSLAIAGRDELATVLLTVPMMVLLALTLGGKSNHYLCMVLRRKRFRATVTSLLHALQARDGYTAEHSEVALRMADGVAAQLGLDDDDRAELVDIALLHDIGKIGIPNSILHKPGKLDEREWKIMRQHPVIGEQILADVPGFENIARAVRHEHERWDGDGYPDGLSGTDIPLASRIVLVCDAYHAMTSDRPYRTAMSDEDAREELRAHAGTQFDPLVVTSMIRALDDGMMEEVPHEDAAGFVTGVEYDETPGEIPGVSAHSIVDEIATETESETAAITPSAKFAPDEMVDVDPANDLGRMMRSAAETWSLSTVVFGVYLVAFSKIDAFGIALVCGGVAVVMASLLLSPPRFAKPCLATISILTFGLTPLVAWHYQEPAILLFFVTPAVSAAAFFWHSRLAKVLQIVAVTAVFMALPLVMFGFDELARALVGTRAFIVAVAVVGYFSRRMSAMEFERERFASTTSSLLLALHTRDGYTAAHSTETVEMAMGVAEQLGLGTAERDELSTIAVLHDIGKIGIADEILNKPGKLDDFEWEIMREHPVIGERIVAQVPGFEDVAKAIRHEHERWDGKGYPDGLTGTDIPLASRIVLACDAYHAMTSDRPYRSAMTDVAARSELLNNAGTQFDPKIVTALIEALDSADILSAAQEPDVAPAADARQKSAA